MTARLAKGPGLAAALCGMLLAAAPAQRPAQPTGEGAAWRVDPYTKNDAAAMARAGYVSFGPFPWGDDHDSRAIEDLLGSTRVRWVETAHFRIGSSLLGYAVPRDHDEMAKLEHELERLHVKLPRVKPKTKELDPWLRLHLFAQRLEDLYQDFAQQMGFQDADFATAPGQGAAAKPAAKPGAKPIADGPYLGQAGKYEVLLVQKASDLGRYLRRYLHMNDDLPMRTWFPKAGSFFFGSAAEYADGTFQDDTAFHCHVVFSMVLDLVDGFRSYTHDVPVWWKEGLAHWFSRRIDAHYSNFTGVKPDANIYKETNWPPKVRARLQFEHFTPAKELLARMDYQAMTFEDHMMSWSRVDYLLSLGAPRARVFMDTLKGRIGEGAELPTNDAVLQRQAQALRLAYGLDTTTLDERWRKWVLDTYPAK